MSAVQPRQTEDLQKNKGGGDWKGNIVKTWHFAATDSTDRWTFAEQQDACARPRSDAKPMFSQARQRYGACKRPNTSHNISQWPLPLHLSICLGRQSILGAVAHYPGWWLSPCQLTVQLAYKATANFYPSVREKGHPYWWCSGYAPTRLHLIVKETWHKR